MVSLRRLRSSRPVRRYVTPLVLAAWLAGCMSWHRQDLGPDLTPRTVVTEKKPSRIRVTLADWRRVEIRSPRIVGDSLVGVPASSGARSGGPKEPPRLSVALADIRSVELRGVSGGRTALLVLGGAMAVGLVASVISSGGNGASSSSGSSGGGSCASSGSCISCPLVFSADGPGWRLDSGTFGGAFLPGLTRTDVDELEAAVPEGDSLRLRLIDALPETDHVDALRLLVVDHARGVAVVPDGAGDLHAISRPTPPLAAVDDRGRDMVRQLREADGWSWSSVPSGRDASRPADLRDGLVLDFPRPPGARSGELLVVGSNTPWAASLMQRFVALHGRETEAWYDSMAASPAASRALGRRLAREAFLRVQLWTASGWRPAGRLWEAGPEVAKRQAVSLDLREAAGPTVRIRLESAPLFWRIDRVALAAPSKSPLRVREARLVRATDAAGRDVATLLAAEDGKEYLGEQGDQAELTYRLPPTPPGTARSFLIRTTGWYRIHAPSTGEPDRRALLRLAADPDGIARVSVTEMGRALEALSRAAGTAVGSDRTSSAAPSAGNDRARSPAAAREGGLR